MEDEEFLVCWVFFIKNGVEAVGIEGFEALDGFFEEDACVALVFEGGENFAPSDGLGALDGKGEEEGRVGMGIAQCLPDRKGVVFAYGLAGIGIVEGGVVAEPDFEEVAELGHGPNGGTGGFNVVGLLDSDAWANVLDGIDIGTVEAFEELAGIGGKGLDVAALAFGVEGLKDEGGFSSSAEASDEDELTNGKVEVDGFEVILPNAAKPDGGMRKGEW